MTVLQGSATISYMLRHFSQQPSLALIQDVLAQFDIPIASNRQVTLIEFQTLSPDSFMWRLLLDGTVYYLYAEDHIDGFEGVHNKISSWFAPNIKIDFIKTRQQNGFTNTTPFKSAAVYKEPDDYEHMKYYTASSGYDFVFLCKSDEDAGSALFNNQNSSR